MAVSSLAFPAPEISSSPSLGVSRTAINAPNSKPKPASSAAITEDTVQLSTTAQQHLQSSAQQARGIVEQLVQAAAAGDSGALSLLTVV